MNTSFESKINRIGLAMQIIAIVMILLTVINCVATIIFETQYQGTTDVAGLVFTQKFISKPWLFIIMDVLICIFNIAAYLFLIRAAVEYRHCETPFSEETMRRTKRFAIMMLISVSMELIVTCINTILLRRVFLIELTPILSASVAFAALLMLLLTNIFRHGMQLQKEVDETL